MTPREALEQIKIMVDKQAEDGPLWFNCETAPEAYTQQALRALHECVENCVAMVAEQDAKADLCDRHGNQIVFPEEYEQQDADPKYLGVDVDDLA